MDHNSSVETQEIRVIIDLIHQINTFCFLNSQEMYYRHKSFKFRYFKLLSFFFNFWKDFFNAN